MDRRGFIFTVTASFLYAPLPVEAQQPARVPRIGLLLPTTSSATRHLIDAFRQGLRELDYVEGQNIAFEHRYGEGRAERLPALAAELVRLKVDVIVTARDEAIRATRQATTTIPIVMANSADPVGTGFVSSLARPGGNITGLTLINPELSGKRLSLLKEAVSGLSRVAVLRTNMAVPETSISFREAEVAANALGLTLQSLQIRGPEEFESAFTAAIRGRADALMVLQEPSIFLHRRQVADLAIKSRLPMIAEIREIADAGAFMSYGPNLADMYRRAATYVNKILRGAKPSDLPIERPTTFELVVNLKTAKALGLTIPQSILLRADRVIE